MKVLRKIRNIIEGWWKHIFGISSEESQIRFQVCEKCHLFTNAHTCSKCGCYIPAKVKSKREKCPLEKW